MMDLEASERGNGGPARRWFAVGSSSDPDPERAATQATGAALEGRDAGLVLVFTSEERDPAAVLAGVRAVSGTAAVVGCTGAGQLTPAGPARHAVVVAALGGPGVAVRTGCATGASAQPRAAGAAAAGCAADLPDLAYQAMLLLTDGPTLGQEEIISGAYQVVGAGVPLVGGASSSAPESHDAATSKTFHLYHDKVLRDAVVAVAIASEAPLAIITRHGFHRCGEPMIVTRAGHQELLTLDDRPALQMYLDRLAAPPAAYQDPAVFFALAQNHPVGIRRRRGEELRYVVGDLDRGVLGYTGELPEGAVVWVMEGEPDGALDAAGEACRLAREALGDHDPIGFLTFDCVARAHLLGERAPVELARMRAEAAGAPFAGFYTQGEIARTQGYNGFHNQSLVVLALA